METICCMNIIRTVGIGFCLLGTGLQAQPNVKVKGYVNAPEEIREPVRISVVNEAGELVWQKVKRHPTMNFRLPAGEVYDITFEQPGALTKTVELDTRNAVRPFSKKQTRPVNFEVIMEVAAVDSLQYSGPVGRIEFRDRNGHMYVEYDYALECLAEECTPGRKRDARQVQ